MAGDHDDFGRILHFAYFLQDFETVDAGEPDVEENEVEGAFAELVETIFAAGTDADLVILVFEDAAQGFADAGFVVDDEDVGHSLT